MWKKREKNGDMMRFCLLCNANEKGRNVGNIPLFREIQICQSHKGKWGVCCDYNCFRVYLGVVETDFVGFLCLSDLLHVLGQLLDVVGG